MSKFMLIALSTFWLAALQALIAVPAAEAAIVCRDGFQRVNGRDISTPYCNDADLARIARSRGSRVSDDEVRANPNRKDEVCRFLNGNPDAREYCPDDGSSDGGR